MERIDQFLSLERNQQSNDRLNALSTYKTQLHIVNWTGAKALKFMIKKGEALE